MKQRNLRKTNPEISLLARKLDSAAKKQKAPIWAKVSRMLLGPSRNWAEVNVEKLDRLTKEKDVVLIPGKLLAAGKISHPVEVYAFRATESAKKMILSAKGNVGTISELVEKNPKGTGIHLIK
jgi:large subunit ribosomal protein L18e